MNQTTYRTYSISLYWQNLIKDTIQHLLKFELQCYCGDRQRKMDGTLDASITVGGNSQITPLITPITGSAKRTC
jgi:hypothetical protein